MVAGYMRPGMAKLQFARRLGLESVVKAIEGVAYEFAEVEEILEKRGIGPALLKVSLFHQQVENECRFMSRFSSWDLWGDAFVQKILINMYGKSHANLGKWGGCFELFSYMILHDSFRAEESTLLRVETAVVDIHDHVEGALSILSRYSIGEGLRPDDVVVGVLSACTCSNAEEGMEYSERMRAEHRIEQSIQHYGCLVDQMVRAGLIDEAHELIESMPMEQNDLVRHNLLILSTIY
ncbi:hypothetical protein C2S53_016158 [Perilla frutescens var. hirtella]|uniref:Pentatricopeptide repeat-containing protein n=1 Tax=Perilla frutescens var. hirtella TaxID=608512 RepID=A0AAD4J4G3_PERFH|nr:hypothetical protein C2S53_016158 [Perilla frutescens var. hirtella]